MSHLARALLSAIIAVSLLTACATPGVVRSDTTMPRLGSITGTTLVMGELGQPAIAVGIGSPVAPILGAESERRRLDLAGRALFDLYETSGVVQQVVAAPDLGPQGTAWPAFLVTYRILNFQEHFDGPEGRYWVGYILGALTAGLGFLISIESHADFTHNYEFEVRVHDVRNVPVVRVQNADGTFGNAYDTSVAPLVMRRNYSAELHSWIGAGTGGPGGSDLDRFLREQGSEIARTMFDLTAQDVVHAVGTAATQAPQAAISRDAPTSGGEAPRATWPQ